MKITSWNINGIRAISKKPDWGKFFTKEKPDIACFQETKASIEQLSAEITHIPGYISYFASSKIKKGYSGVTVYTKETPGNVEEGMGIEKFDVEGRMLTLYYEDFVIINTYYPNGGQGPHRLEYKLEFYDAFLEYIEKIREKHKKIIFCGDVNTAHEEIDLARPKENEKNTGFLTEERAWLDELLSHGYIDTFRELNPTKTGVYSYWDMKTRARDRNVGWRIDYVFTTSNIAPKIKNAFILNNVYGSDHCPVGIELV